MMAIYLVILALAILFFLTPAIIVIWPFVGSLSKAVDIASLNLWAWLGSAVTWVIIYIRWRKSKNATEE